ncbi:hypothetical protein AB3S75_000430 [Citrus x aurantiifolia]
MERVKIPIKISRGSNGHPDEGRDPKAIPKIRGFNGQVFPLPCPQLQNKSSSWCSFLEFSGEDLNFGVQMNCILGMETAFSKLRL